MKLNSTFHFYMFYMLIRMISEERYFDFGHDLEVGDILNLGDHLSILSWICLNGVENKMVVFHKKRITFFQVLVDELRKVKGVEMVNKKKYTMIEVLLHIVFRTGCRTGLLIGLIFRPVF
ncbi:hypothetical protein Hanom_Chr03g00244481 [Helianthus anomalus]